MSSEGVEAKQQGVPVLAAFWAAEAAGREYCMHDHLQRNRNGGSNRTEHNLAEVQHSSKAASVAGPGLLNVRLLPWAMLAYVLQHAAVFYRHLLSAQFLWRKPGG